MPLDAVGCKREQYGAVGCCRAHKREKEGSGKCRKLQQSVVGSGRVP